MPLWLTLVILAPFIGSFLGVLAGRLPESKPVIADRSRCESCNHVLSPLDLVPVAAWLYLRGRCRYCGSALGWSYPAVEIGAVVVVLWASTITSGAVLVASCIFGWTLLPLAITDWRHYLLPDPLVLALAVTGLIAIGFIDPASIVNHIVGVVVGFAALTGLAFAYRRLRGREGLGAGDAKLLGALGAWLSWEGLPSALLLAALLGLLFAGLRSTAGLKTSWTDRLPFGSFLAAGGWLVWLYGPLTFG